MLILKKNSSRREKADFLKDAVARYFLEKRYAVNFEVGINKHGNLRSDVIATNMRSEIVIVETKSCPSDFNTDKKWANYLSYCNQFYFCFGTKTYEKVKEKIPNGVGVFVVNSNGNIWIELKAAKRPVQPDNLVQVLVRMCYRSADRNRHTHRSKVK